MPGATPQAPIRHPNARAPVPPRIRVGFILARHFTLCAFANFVDVLRLSADEGDRSRPILCQWAVLSDTMAPVMSSSGVSVQPTERLGDPKKFDYIAVVGGLTEGLETFSPAYQSYLHAAAAAGVPLIGLCTGVFALHKLGLMQGYRCCVSWFHHADFLDQFDGLMPVSDQIFVVDRDRLTCSGGVSSAHLAAHLVERHIGRAKAANSLHIMIIDAPQSPEKPQPASGSRYATEDDIVRRALLLMQQFIEMPLTVEEIAARLGQGKRRIERHFRQAIGVSPQEAYLMIRLDQACQMLEKTSKPISQIAVESGFCDASHMSRMFRSRLQSSPAAWRARKGVGQGG